ncbi:restriction endonuclease [Mesorhizobium australafricanum]|uniref:Restriction endonuclease n=1 Tax=Mesorhizobium australafricanum TaxID=3072311 RepID=A0ABU4X2I6_9HYPH|nr:restriction endonuclease [Mesorhizobium sp. VK3E]MDX8442532.1 restriction endonuclease [Mesorhizobium sp. VK3E]
MKEATAISAIADLLYDFLPGSGNSRTAFPLAANEAGVADFWQQGSKLPSLVQLLTVTLERRRNRFCPLINAIVRQSMTWRRGRGDPLKREEIEQLNSLLRGVSFSIPELTDASFLDMLPRREPPPVEKTASGKPTTTLLASLSQQLIEVSKLAPQPRGYAFEKFLYELFTAYDLAPRGSFRNTGEQIDGSFAVEGETYLLEAKWQNEYSGVAELDRFAGKVGRQAKWARGLFISNTGFSPDGLTAFGKASTSIICMDGFDLHETLSRQLSFADVISRKVRRAVETGGPFVRVRDLF